MQDISNTPLPTVVLAIPKVNFDERMGFVAETVKSRHSHRTLGIWRESKSYKGRIGLLEWKQTTVDICLLCNSQHQTKDTIIQEKQLIQKGSRGRRAEGRRGGGRENTREGKEEDK